MVSEEAHYLGFDFSTQQLKGVIVNDSLEVVHKSCVIFDVELPEFRTQNGVQRGSDKSVTTPVLLWVKALDLLLDKLSLLGADFSKVAALSGAAQQHGTVYWTVGAEETLKSLDPSHFLHTQAASLFAVSSSPVWLDSTTGDQCTSLHGLIGGPLGLARITGSKAYERFSAAQIAKIYQTKPTAYKSTERISLVSNFACSLLLGRYAPIDWSDASGMNLFHIIEKKWHLPCLEAVAPDLESKLGEPVPSNTILGTVSKYLVDRFGFSEDCQVVAFTGDNPSSIAGLAANMGDIIVSLGTSDTVMMRLHCAPSDPSLPAKPPVLLEGHIMIDPLEPHDGYMALLCFKNGSLTREKIRDVCAKSSWQEFSNLLSATPPGNNGYLGLYYHVEEIIPSNIEGEFRYNASGQPLAMFPNDATEVRALIEGQLIARRAVTQDLPFHHNTSGCCQRLLATGGASVNSSILQVMSDVFKAPVHTIEMGESAALGGAYRAKYVVKCPAKKNDDSGDDNLNCYSDMVRNCIEEIASSTPAAVPNLEHSQVYDVMVERYKEIINTLLEAKASS